MMKADHALENLENEVDATIKAGPFEGMCAGRPELADYTRDQYRPAEPLTNADRIRQMTDEELVMTFDTDCTRCAKSENCELRGDPVSYGICVKGNIEWLKQEVS